MWEHMYVSDFFSDIEKNGHKHGSETVQNLGLSDTPAGAGEQCFMSACLSCVQNQDFHLPPRISVFHKRISHGLHSDWGSLKCNIFFLIAHKR